MSTNEKKDDAQEAAEQAARLSRRDLLKSGGAFGLAGIATATGAGAAAAAATVATPAVASAATGACDGQADDSRSTLGGSPISDAPIGSETVLPPLQERVLALRDLVLKAGLIPPAPPAAGLPAGSTMIDFFLHFYRDLVGPQWGRAVVAHAWKNPGFMHALTNPPASRPFEATRLVADFLETTEFAQLVPQSPGATLGPEGEWLLVKANGLGPDGKRRHHMAVCVGCSCYPQALLGPQPVWYKSRQYRARSVQNPRSVMREFAGVKGPEASDRLEGYLAGIDEICVWDSNSESRYLVIPEMPPEAEGLSEEQCRALVTRNSMVGVEIV